MAVCCVHNTNPFSVRDLSTDARAGTMAAAVSKATVVLTALAALIAVVSGGGCK